MGDGVQCRQDIVALSARRPANEETHQAPQVAQERPKNEVCGVDEQDRTLATSGLCQPWLQLGVEEGGLSLGVRFGRDGPYLAPAKAETFFRKPRT